MAKQKINSEEAAQGVGADIFQETEIQDEGVSLPVTTTSESVPQGDAPEPQPQKASTNEKKQEKSISAEPDSHTLDILKSFSQYESLYVDGKGGIYAPNTPRAIRGSATLYKNPYYKK